MHKGAGTISSLWVVGLILHRTDLIVLMVVGLAQPSVCFIYWRASSARLSSALLKAELLMGFPGPWPHSSPALLWAPSTGIHWKHWSPSCAPFYPSETPLWTRAACRATSSAFGDYFPAPCQGIELLNNVHVLLSAGRAGNAPAWINVPLLHCSHQVLTKGIVILKTIKFYSFFHKKLKTVALSAPSQENGAGKRLHSLWANPAPPAIVEDKVWTLGWFGEVSISQLKSAPL